jgi:coenzyme F420-reducing hydrogenase alpha subunit
MSDEKKSRTIKVDYLARVEGEGSLYIKIKGGEVEDVRLKIFEPPRGLLYHRYRIDERGLIADAKIVPPTSQNQKRIEAEALEQALALIR